MTQYPGGYQQPPYQPNFDYYQPQEDPLTPARRASTLMFFVGGLVILGGFCCIGMGSALPSLLQQQPELAQQMSAMGNFPPHVIQTALIVLGIVSFIIGIALLVLARFVRNGGLAPIVTALVLCGMVLIYCIINTIAVLAMGGAPAQKPVSACVSFVPVILFGLLLKWLIQAARNSPRVSQARQQYAAQYWEYYQQRQAYSQGPYAPPPPPQNLPPPPPPPQ